MSKQWVRITSGLLKEEDVVTRHDDIAPCDVRDGTSSEDGFSIYAWAHLPIQVVFDNYGDGCKIYRWQEPLEPITRRVFKLNASYSKPLPLP